MNPKNFKTVLMSQEWKAMSQEC